MSNPVAKRLSRRFQISMLLDGLAIGVVVGGVITLYRLSLSHAERLLRLIIDWAKGDIARGVLWCGVLALLLVVVSLIIRRVPSAASSGIPQVEAELERKYEAPWLSTLIAKFAAGTLSAFCGLSLGREGPSIQLGGMAAKGVARALDKPDDELRILMTCGAAAGMSAAFHAPLTGVMFAIEEIHKSFTAPLVISVMAASIGADYVSSQILGLEPVLSFKLSEYLPHTFYAVLIAMGVVFGVLGALHNKGMFVAKRFMDRIEGPDPLKRYALAFAAAGVLAFVAPELLCGGDAILEALEGQRIAGWSFLGLLVAKYLFTTLCFGSGAPGGTLFPMVVMGGLAGSAFGVIACSMGGLPTSYYVNFAMLGICALFASAVRSPVTAVILVFELTGSFDALLSLSIVSITSYLIANCTLVEPFYEHLLANYGSAESQDAELKGKQLVHGHVVEIGSALAGKKVSEIAWPEDVLVVSVVRDGIETTPTGATVIEALDTLTIVMDAARAAEHEAWLFDMCRGETGYITNG